MNGATEIKVSSLDREEDDEHNSAGFVEISKIFAMQATFILGTGPLDRFQCDSVHSVINVAR